MSKLVLSLSDITEISTIGKFLKNKQFMIINTPTGVYGVGLDDINYYVIRIKDNMLLSSFSIDSLNIGLIFNYRELSSFMKNLSTENEFIIDLDTTNNILYTSVGAIELNIKVASMNQATSGEKLDLYTYKSIFSVLNRSALCNEVDQLCIEEGEVTESIQGLLNLRVTDGSLYYIHDNKYYMTLFSGLLPVNKTDKIYLSIIDKGSTFIARFRIHKKKEVYAYVEYLNIPR